MNVVYEPKGRAREYSPLACNLYTGCSHGCKYCYAPSCMRTTGERWHTNITPRKDVITKFEKDTAKLRGDDRKVLFCFLTDPYQPIEGEKRITRHALEIAKRNHIKTQILTKGSKDILADDLPLMKEIGTELGLTICFKDDKKRAEWEPNASPISDRFEVLREAHKMGIFTWVSLEPVIDPDEALAVIERVHPYVRFWKIGKLNHMKEVEKKVDWKAFLCRAENLLASVSANYYIKNDLRVYR